LELQKYQENQLAPANMNQSQWELVKRTYCSGASDDEFLLYMNECKRSGLMPGKQIHAVFRWDGKDQRKVMKVQVGIDGYRLIAERSGKYQGQIGPYWCGKDGDWRDVWLEDSLPMACKVGVIRAGFSEPIWGVAKFSNYAQTNQNGSLSAMWAKMPDLMIAKCAEALALRKAFPEDLSGLYTQEEMQQEYRPEPEKPEPQVVLPNIANPNWTDQPIHVGLLPFELRDQGITFEDLATKEIKFTSRKNQREYTGRQMVHIWANDKVDTAKAEVGQALLALYPSKKEGE
jgi:phage recombination protein Bet